MLSYNNNNNNISILLFLVVYFFDLLYSILFLYPGLAV